MEEMSVFKSYLRRLLQDLKDLKEAIKNGEYETILKYLYQQVLYHCYLPEMLWLKKIVNPQH